MKFHVCQRTLLRTPRRFHKRWPRTLKLQTIAWCFAQRRTKRKSSDETLICGSLVKFIEIFQWWKW